MKFAVVFAIVALVLVQSSIAQSHNAEWGKREDGDKQLYTEIIIRNSSEFRKIDVHYSGAYHITYIKATDQHTNGNGGTASLINGGVGNSEAIIELKSQHLQGINYILEIYGT